MLVHIVRLLPGVVGFRLLSLGGALLNLSEALLESFGYKVELPMWRLRIARYDGVEHGDQMLRIRLDLEIFLPDDVPDLCRASDGHPHLHKTDNGVNSSDAYYTVSKGL